MILDRARVAPAIGMQGLALHKQSRERALIQFEHQRPTPGLGQTTRVHTLIEDNWRLSIYHGVSWGELYDLKRDPGEIENLWDDPNHGAIRAHLTEALLRAEIDAIDRSVFPIASA